jgi:hypothetical protein
MENMRDEYERYLYEEKYGSRDEAAYGGIIGLYR